MERLVAVVQQLSLARTLDAVVAIVRTAARDLTGADGATFILRDGEDCYYADEDAIEPLWKGRRFRLTHCVSGWAMIHRRAAVIPDIYADARVPADAYRPTFVKSSLVVPIRAFDPIGAIGNYWAARHEPTAEQIAILQALADTTAVALENVEVYAQLEKRVAERTSELQALNAELDQFCHSISHDLRAPVRAIAGFCALIDKDHGAGFEPELHRKLGIIKSEAHRMGTLIEDLLAFSRLGRKALTPDDVDMNALVQRVLERLRREPGAPQVDVRVATLPRAEGDQSLLEHVWANLLSNAFKFTGKRTRPEIEIGGVAVGQEHQYFVRDNGEGFDPRQAGRLFQPFQRLHPPEDFPGTGVGLALVQRIVTRHRGRVWAEAAPGEGATFRFALPHAGAAGAAS